MKENLNTIEKNASLAKIPTYNNDANPVEQEMVEYDLNEEERDYVPEEVYHPDKMTSVSQMKSNPNIA